MPQADYEQCEHFALIKNGFNPTVKRGPVQRFRCKFCGQAFNGSRSLFERRIAIGRDLIQGFSVRAVMRRNDVSFKAVKRVREMLGDRRPILCGTCGKPVGHSGRCGALDTAEYDRVIVDLKAGVSLNAIVERNGIAWHTLYKIMAAHPGIRPALCPCGRPTGHRGRRLRNCSNV